MVSAEATNQPGRQSEVQRDPLFIRRIEGQSRAGSKEYHTGKRRGHRSSSPRTTAGEEVIVRRTLKTLEIILRKPAKPSAAVPKASNRMDLNGQGGKPPTSHGWAQSRHCDRRQGPGNEGVTRYKAAEGRKQNAGGLWARPSVLTPMPKIGVPQPQFITTKSTKSNQRPIPSASTPWPKSSGKPRKCRNLGC